MQRDRRVVITGIGPLTSIGIGKNSLWDSLIKEKTNVKLEEWFVNGELWEKFYLHKIEHFDIREFNIERKKLEEIKKWKEGEEVTDLYYLLAAVQLALEDSELKYNPEDNNIGCVITHENPGFEQYFSKVFDVFFEKIKRGANKKESFKEFYQYLSKDSYELQTFMVLFHILKTFNIHGFSLFVNNACASGLYALEAASQIIKQGKCPAVVVTAGDYPRIYKHLWFKQLGMYAEDGKIKPFSEEANGFILGDGAASLILEDLEYALKRKAKIYAEYLGGGFSQEGWKVTLPSIGSDYYQKAIKEAVKVSGVNKEDIDLVCAHGVGNSIIDRYEARAITDVFGKNFKKPLVTAFKPYVGHNLGGSTLLETAILLLCMENNMVLPVLNVRRVDRRMNMEIVKAKVKTNLKVALKTCCAFAGYNAAAVFRKM